MASFVPFQQHEELTTRISNILNEYVVSTSVLREFVQNADDAGARKFALCLDMASCAAGGGEGLLSPRLGEYQGPALLAYNDAPFSDADFASIVNVGRSGKAADAATIGKYGLGFNVSYHFADVVSFVSRDQLVLFDPHGAALPDGLLGLRADSCAAGLGRAPRRAAAAVRARAARARRRLGRRAAPAPLDGTLFRLPLRTRAQASRSRLSARAWLADDGARVDDELGAMLRDFGAAAPELLLFLQHVEEIAVYARPAGGGDARLVRARGSDGLDAARARARRAPRRARAARPRRARPADADGEHAIALRVGVRRAPSGALDAAGDEEDRRRKRRNSGGSCGARASPTPPPTAATARGRRDRGRRVARRRAELARLADALGHPPWVGVAARVDGARGAAGDERPRVLVPPAPGRDRPPRARQRAVRALVEPPRAARPRQRRARRRRGAQGAVERAAAHARAAARVRGAARGRRPRSSRARAAAPARAALARRRRRGRRRALRRVRRRDRARARGRALARLLRTRSRAATARSASVLLADAALAETAAAAAAERGGAAGAAALRRASPLLDALARTGAALCCPPRRVRESLERAVALYARRAAFEARAVARRLRAVLRRPRTSPRACGARPTKPTRSRARSPTSCSTTYSRHRRAPAPRADGDAGADDARVSRPPLEVLDGMPLRAARLGRPRRAARRPRRRHRAATRPTRGRHLLRVRGRGRRRQPRTATSPSTRARASRRARGFARLLRHATKPDAEPRSTSRRSTRAGCCSRA